MNHPWLWPTALKDDPAWHVRLGRVVHWTFTGLAALAVVAGAYAIYEDRRGLAENRKEIAAWDAMHPHPSKKGYVLTQVPNDYGGYDHRPYERSADDAGFYIGLIVAAIFALFGRGLRYILSGE